MKISYLSNHSLQTMEFPFALDDTYFGLEAFDKTTSVGLLVGQQVDCSIYIHHLTAKPSHPQALSQLLQGVKTYGAALDVTAFHYQFEANTAEESNHYAGFLHRAGWPVPEKKVLYYVVAKSKNPLYQRGNPLDCNCQILPLSQIPWDVRLSYIASHDDDLDFSQYQMLEPSMSLALIQENHILGYCLVQIQDQQPALTKMVWPENKALIAPLASATSHALESLPYPTVLVHIHTQMGAVVCQKWFDKQILSSHQILESNLLL